VGLDSYIVDPKNHKNAHIVTHNDKDSSNSLVVATHPLKQFQENTLFFTNDTFGINMNIQAGQFGGNPLVIYKENVEWTTSAISGTWTFNSGTVGAIAPHGGSVMIDATATSNNDTMQLSNISSLDLSNYTSITGYINITAWSVVGIKAVNIYGWNTGTGTIVGIAVNIGTYVNTGSLSTWQKFTIPLENMGLKGSTINAFRIATISSTGTVQNYYLDDIQIEEVSGESETSSASFSIQPNNETWLHISSFTFFFADDDYAPVLATGLMTGIPYDSLLGVSSLAGGLIYNRYQDGEIIVTEKIQQLSGLFRMPSTVISGYGISKDYAGSWVSIFSPVAEPIILKAEDQDKITWTISEDLSGLSIFNISAACKIEYRV